MKKLTYLFLTVLIVGCSSDNQDNNDGDNNQSSCNGDNPVYLADNGVTIKACDDANVGDTGVIDGVTYMVVGETLLREMAANEEDVTTVVTTKVTNMNYMFRYATSFNQPIGNWDVSNVTRMEYMFFGAEVFNQPIGSWDVSNVTDMYFTFGFTPNFNQPIGAWDVSNVNTMEKMFWEATAFNRNLSYWEVDNVTYCYAFDNGATSWTLPQPNFTNCTP